MNELVKFSGCMVKMFYKHVRDYDFNYWQNNIRKSDEVILNLMHSLRSIVHKLSNLNTSSETIPCTAGTIAQKKSVLIASP